MDPKVLKRQSKFLSYVLRHHPETVGVTLDAAGWVGVEALLSGCASHGRPLSRQELLEVVASNSKQRFELSSDGTRIRATQGHSVPVELGYAPAEPPERLFHGTVREALPAIGEEGLQPMGRHHVHLSPDHATAVQVGGRRGKPVVLQIDAARMVQQGHAFFRTPNGVWLTERVAPCFILNLEAELAAHG